MIFLKTKMKSQTAAMRLPDVAVIQVVNAAKYQVLSKFYLRLCLYIYLITYTDQRLHINIDSEIFKCKLTVEYNGIRANKLAITISLFSWAVISRPV